MRRVRPRWKNTQARQEGRQRARLRFVTDLLADRVFGQLQGAGINPHDFMSELAKRVRDAA